MWYEDGDMQADEMERALKESRQPKCMYCNNPLDKICQTQYDRITWEWRPELKKYVKLEPEGDSDAPYHLDCQSRDYGYVDGKLVSY